MDDLAPDQRRRNLHRADVLEGLGEAARQEAEVRRIADRQIRPAEVEVEGLPRADAFRAADRGPPPGSGGSRPPPSLATGRGWRRARRSFPSPERRRPAGWRSDRGPAARRAPLRPGSDRRVRARRPAGWPRPGPGCGSLRSPPGGSARRARSGRPSWPRRSRTPPGSAQAPQKSRSGPPPRAVARAHARCAARSRRARSAGDRPATPSPAPPRRRRRPAQRAAPRSSASGAAAARPADARRPAARPPWPRWSRWRR